MHAAREGHLFVAAELTRRGADAVELPSEPGTDVRAAVGGRSVELTVRSRRTGDWQVRASLGEPRSENPDEAHYWAFVDLGDRPGPPAYFIAPDWWVRNDIDLAHREYLSRHGGQRARSPESDHHRITTKRVEQWRDRWDLLVPG